MQYNIFLREYLNIKDCWQNKNCNLYLIKLCKIQNVFNVYSTEIKINIYIYL